MKQQLNVQAEFEIEIDAKYSKRELKEMVVRNLMRAFHNNARKLVKFSFQEEAEIYGNK